MLSLRHIPKVPHGAINGPSTPRGTPLHAVEGPNPQRRRLRRGHHHATPVPASAIAPSLSACLCLSPWFPWFVCLSTQRPRLRWRLRDAVRRTRTSRPSPFDKSLVRLVVDSAVRSLELEGVLRCFLPRATTTENAFFVGREGTGDFLRRGSLRIRNSDCCRGYVCTTFVVPRTSSSVAHAFR